MKIGDFRRKFGRRFITLSVHLICLQHVRRDAACRADLSVTAEKLIYYYLMSHDLL